MDKGESKKKKKTPRQIQQENENETKLVAPIAPTPIILGNKPLKKNIMHGEKNATLNSSPENKQKKKPPKAERYRNSKENLLKTRGE